MIGTILAVPIPMREKKALKAQGLAFGRSLQTAFKTVVMYSADHPAAERLLGQSYASLSALLKQSKQFTFGFANRRVVLNQLVTDDATLNQLADEFGKRGIAAVSFTAGIGAEEFKRVLALLAAKPKLIAEKGGIRSFLEQNPVRGARIVLAEKRSGEDSELAMDPESFQLAQDILGVRLGSGSSSLDMLMQSAGLSQPQDFTGGSGETLALAGKAAEAVLLNPAADPSALVANLARVLETWAPERLFAGLPPEKQAELRSRPIDEVARNIVEDSAVEWAARRLSQPQEGKTAPAAEEDVLHILVRSLKATRVAERLLAKLSQFVAEANLPREVYDRIRQGLAWYGLPQEERHEQLMARERFGEVEFRRLLDYLRETLREGKVRQAVAVAGHYFGFLDGADSERQKEELGRAPEVLKVMATPQTLEFLRATAGRLSKKFQEDTLRHEACHEPLARCLSRTAQLLLAHQELEPVLHIGQSLENSRAKDPAQHAGCCGRALEQLLTPEVVEQLVHSYFEKGEDPARGRLAASLLRLAGATAAEKVFQRLEEETVAANRMRLMNLFIRLGSGGIELARKRLQDERWYVVRNACHVLGELHDPELPPHLHDALRHADARVQQAAVSAILKCRAPQSAGVLADSLTTLPAQLVETVLDELAFLKDPASVPGLAQFLLQKKSGPADALERAVRVLAAIASENAVQGLGEILLDTDQLLSVRKLAVEALLRSDSPFARRLLTEFPRIAPDDPLAADCRRAPSSKS